MTRLQLDHVLTTIQDTIAGRCLKQLQTSRVVGLQYMINFSSLALMHSSYYLKLDYW